MKYYINLIAGILFGGIMSACQAWAATIGLVTIMQCSIIAMISGAVSALLAPMLAKKYQNKYVEENDLTAYIFMVISILVPGLTYIVLYMFK